jgi:Uncharacterized protein conserved in bacteria (DUF2066)
MDRIAMAQSRLLIAFGLAGLLAWWPAPAARAQTAAEVFQVSGIAVDATAADAVAAREQALLDGQSEGLRRLMRRLVPPEEHGRLPSVGPAEIERYVQNFEIAEEQVASNRYLAQLTVRYEPDAVRELLQAGGLSYAETVSVPVVVLPVYRTPNGPLLWPENNPWWKAWADNLDPERLLRLILPLGDLEDMAMLTVDRAMAGDTDALTALARRYGGDDVLMVIATPRGGAPTGAAGAEAAATAAPALELETRRGGIEQATPSETLAGVPGQTLDGLMAEAVIGLQDTLDERWKSANLLRYDQAGIMVVDIPIARLADWVEISRGLEGLAEVAQVEVAAFARDNVRAQLRYIGDQVRLEEALRRIGLALSRKGESWLLLPMGESPSQGEPASATSTSS